MTNHHTDLFLRIRKVNRTQCAVEAWLSDGSFYTGEWHLSPRLLGDLNDLSLQPEQYGAKLFESLFRERIGVALAVATALAGERSEGRLRIRLALDSSLPAEAWTIRWEWLCQTSGQDEMPLAIDPITPISRYATLAKEEPEPLNELQIRLLFVVSAPSDVKLHADPIDVEMELTKLHAALQDVWCSGRCVVTIMPGQSGVSDALRAALEQSKCRIVTGPATLENISRNLDGQHVLHFLGHGKLEVNQGALLLEKEDGTAIWTTDEDLAGKLKNREVRLVFLAACSSGEGHLTLQRSGMGTNAPASGLAAYLVETAYIPAVIAMQARVSQETAFQLAAEFYRRFLLVHGTVDTALNEARNLLYRSKKQDWAIPVLYMRIKSGQLTANNPLWAALQGMHEDPLYSRFRSGGYIALPVRAIEINPGQDPAAPRLPEPTGAVEVNQAVLARLSAKTNGSAARDTTPLVFILGGPGSNNSVQLQRLGWDTISASMQPECKDRILPIYLQFQAPPPVSTEIAEALSAQIVAALAEFWPTLAGKALDDLPEQVSLRILCDAVRSLPETGRDLIEGVIKLRQEYVRHQFVVALPVSAFGWSQIATQWTTLTDASKLDASQLFVLAIQPLTQQTLRQFLQSSEQARSQMQDLLEKLYENHLFAIAYTPSFAVRLIRQAVNHRFPESCTGFLCDLVAERLSHIPVTKGMRTDTEQVLMNMAWQIQRNTEDVLPIREAFQIMKDARGERGYTVEELYAELLGEDILAQVGDNQVGFTQLDIRAYYCARAILDLPNSNASLSDIVQSLGSPIRLRRWEQTLVVLCGLLAMPRGQTTTNTLRFIFEPLIYGGDLMTGETVFLAARCLLELHGLAQTNELEDFVYYTINALQWRADSSREPDPYFRLRAIQLLAQLAAPQVTLALARTTYDKLARTTYDKVRKNTADNWDYEFTTIRFAAAIALKRLARKDAEDLLRQVNATLPELFGAWQDQETATLINYYRSSADVGIQGIAVLALGDLYWIVQQAGSEEAKRIEEFLQSTFLAADTVQPIRWALADALSRLDLDMVVANIVQPALKLIRESLEDHGAVHKIAKSLAYLIGLLHLRDQEVLKFLREQCLGIADGRPLYDWSTWATALTALGRIADPADGERLAMIASGGSETLDLNQLFSEEWQRNYVRSSALEALKDTGELNQKLIKAMNPMGADCIVGPTYYRAVREMYWRTKNNKLLPAGKGLTRAQNGAETVNADQYAFPAATK